MDALASNATVEQQRRFFEDTVEKRVALRTKGQWPSQTDKIQPDYASRSRDKGVALMYLDIYLTLSFAELSFGAIQPTAKRSIV